LRQRLREWFARGRVVVLGLRRSRHDRLLLFLLFHFPVAPRRPNKTSRSCFLLVFSLRVFVLIFVFVFRGRRGGSVVRQWLGFAQHGPLLHHAVQVKITMPPFLLLLCLSLLAVASMQGLVAWLVGRGACLCFLLVREGFSLLLSLGARRAGVDGGGETDNS